MADTPRSPPLTHVVNGEAMLADEEAEGYVGVVFSEYLTKGEVFQAGRCDKRQPYEQELRHESAR
jgi:hypothetical protein